MNRGPVIVALSIIVALAAVLRLARLDEMEYKADEQWMYETAVAMAADHTWPLLGMHSSAGVPNPALSAIVFVALARIRSVPSPVDLAAAVVWMNVLALALVVFVAAPVVGERDAAAWRWGGALAAVSPFAILLQRKVWAQCVLPVFSVMFLVAWSRRHRTAWAFAWGLLAAVLGQIHMSGFFFAAGFVLWELWAERYDRVHPPTRWPAFGAGALIGSVGIVSWLLATMVTKVSPGVGAAQTPGTAVTPAAVVHWAFGSANWIDFHVISLWPSHWLNWFFDATGFGLQYSLGAEYGAFLRSPIVEGRPTFLALVATVVSVGLGLRVAVPWARDVWRRFREGRLWSELRTADATTQAEGAALTAFAVLLTATAFTAQRHYLIVAYPLPWVWLARLTLRRPRGRLTLGAIWIAQLAISVSFLAYIHQHRGAAGGDYGVAYRWQTKAPLP